jgi:hypothetical protein
MPNAQRQMPNAKCQMPNAKRQMLETLNGFDLVLRVHGLNRVG